MPALLVGIGTFDDFCAFAEQTGLCGDRPDSTVAMVALVRQGPVGAPVGEGVYSGYVDDPVTGDQTFQLASLATYGPACEPTEVGVTGLHVEIDEVNAERVDELVEIDMATDPPYEGHFTVPVCPITPADPCVVLLGILEGSFCPDPACVP